MDSVVVLKLEKKKNLQPVNVRAPPDEIEWLQSKMGHGEDRLDFSEVVRWALKMGHEYFDALGMNDKRITELANAAGRTRTAFVADLIEAGLAAYDRERKTGSRK